MIKGKSPEEIRKLFNIQNEYASFPICVRIKKLTIQFLGGGGGTDPKGERVGRGVSFFSRIEGLADITADKRFMGSISFDKFCSVWFLLCIHKVASLLIQSMHV
jgi:hypothetical protein